MSVAGAGLRVYDMPIIARADAREGPVGQDCVVRQGDRVVLIGDPCHEAGLVLDQMSYGMSFGLEVPV